jgi:hypothetical protein
MSWTISMTISPVALTWLLEQGATALWGALTAVALGGVLLASLLRRVMPQAAATVTNRSGTSVPPEPETVPANPPSS